MMSVLRKYVFPVRCLQLHWFKSTTYCHCISCSFPNDLPRMCGYSRWEKQSVCARCTSNIMHAPLREKDIMTHFHWRVRVGSVCKCGTGGVSTAKSERDPYWAILSRTRLAVLLRWGTERPERVPASSSYTRRWLVDKIVTSVRLGDINNQTQYPQCISGQRWKFIEENVAQ